MRSVLTLGLLFASVCVSQKVHTDWQRGELVALSVGHVLNPIERDWAREIYEYALDGGEILYIADFDRPLKSALHDPIQFTVQKEQVVVIDKGQRRRVGSIRARVLKKRIS